MFYYSEVKNMDKATSWIRAAGIRAIKTICQTAIGVIGASGVMSEVNWTMVGSASLLAGILSLLTSAAGLPEVDGNNNNSDIDNNTDGSN